MEQIWTMILLWLQFQAIGCVNYKSPSQNQSYSLNSNLIINSNISNPAISPSYYVNYNNNQSGWTTKVQYVQYVDACIFQQSSILACPSFHGVTCGWQFLDTDSSFQNEQYYQRLTLAAGLEFQFKFDWLSQVSYLLSSTGFSVIWNGKTIDSIYDNSCTLQTSTYYLISIAGTNEIVIAGIGIADSEGMLIRNIQLRQLVYASITTANTTNSSANGTTTTNTTATNNTTNINNTASNGTINFANQTNITTSNSTTNSTSNPPINTTNQTIPINSSTPNITNTTIPDQTNANSTFDTTTIPSDTTTIPSDTTTIPNDTSTGRNENNTQIIPALPEDTPFTFESLANYFNASQYQKIFKIITFMQNFQVTKVVNTLATFKQNAKFVFGLILEFNHLLLYNYHLLNYTLMSNVILTGMQALSDEKGRLLDQHIYPFLGTSAASINSDFDRQNNLPVNMNNVISEFLHRPNGIFLEFADILFLQFPITLAIFTLGYIAFRLLFKWKISVVLRQYSILGCFFYAFLDGKIEILTFYFLNEALMLTSSYFGNKCKVVTIVLVYFFVFFFSLASMLLLKAKYGKLVRYVYQNCKDPNKSVTYMTVGYGVYNLLLGFVHRILIYYPMVQLYVLIFIQCLYLVYLLMLLVRHRFENSWVGVTLWLMNCARLVFIATFLFYQLYPDSEYNTSLVQQYFLYSFLLLWALSSLLLFLQKIVILCKAVVYECKHSRTGSRVTPIQAEAKPIEPPHFHLHRSEGPSLRRPPARVDSTQIKRTNHEPAKQPTIFFRNEIGIYRKAGEGGKQSPFATPMRRRKRVLQSTVYKVTFTIK